MLQRQAHLKPIKARKFRYLCHSASETLFPYFLRIDLVGIPDNQLIAIKTDEKLTALDRTWCYC